MRMRSDLLRSSRRVQQVGAHKGKIGVGIKDWYKGKFLVIEPPALTSTLTASLALSTIGAQRLFAGSGIRVGVVGGSGLGLRSGLSLGSNVFVEAVEAFGFSTVKVEPPITNEVALVEDGTVGAQEGVLGQTTSTVGGTDMESLTFGLGISVVSFKQIN